MSVPGRGLHLPLWTDTLPWTETPSWIRQCITSITVEPSVLGHSFGADTFLLWSLTVTCFIDYFSILPGLIVERGSGLNFKEKKITNEIEMKIVNLRLMMI